jgi:hypothetical protein
MKGFGGKCEGKRQFGRLSVDGRIMYGLFNCNWIDTRVAAVQYTLTDKQYTEQHSETKYTERNVHNNDDTQANKRTHIIIIKIYNMPIRIHNLQN